MRRMQRLEPKKHDCGQTTRKNWMAKNESSNRTVMEMELRAI